MERQEPRGCLVLFRRPYCYSSPDKNVPDSDAVGIHWPPQPSQLLLVLLQEASHVSPKSNVLHKYLPPSNVNNKDVKTIEITVRVGSNKKRNQFSQSQVKIEAQPVVDSTYSPASSDYFTTVAYHAID